MVCQSAGKTRFRALKHENGIAGNATIIVRVIACFQPLQDCQAEYFRQLLKPVTFHLQHKICQHMKMNGMTNPNSSSPGSQSMCHEHTSPFKCMVDKAMQPRLVACKRATSAFNLLFCPAGGQTDAAARKRFLVFDQSGDGTNLIVSSVSPHASNLNQKSLASSGLCMNFLVNRSTNNHPIDQSDEISKSFGNGCDEMHEDTEEIDALLYSGSEDEEASTDHSPDKISAIDEEVASSTVPTKRKRLVEEIDTALIDTASSDVRFHCHLNAGDNDKWSAAKHSRVQGVGNERDFSWASGPNKRLKRERIQDTMCVLRRIIPGGKGKDTVAVLDKAIQYLRSLKAQTKNKEFPNLHCNSIGS